MFKVMFYSFTAKKNVEISKHKKLETAIKKARKAWSEDGYNNVLIVTPEGKELDRYGKDVQCPVCDGKGYYDAEDSMLTDTHDCDYCK